MLPTETPLEGNLARVYTKSGSVENTFGALSVKAVAVIQGVLASHVDSREFARATHDGFFA
jgi:hypothetical protein